MAEFVILFILFVVIILVHRYRKQKRAGRLTGTGAERVGQFLGNLGEDARAEEMAKAERKAALRRARWEARHPGRAAKYAPRQVPPPPPPPVPPAQ